jgi:hypothetical protein
MSIFSAIKDAIFGREAKASTAAPPSATGATAAPRSAINPPAAPPAAAAPAPKPAQPVDVEAVVEQYAAKSGQKLNWRTSIVDLLKALGIDSSLAARKKLSEELGFDGDNSDTAAMNIWLHKRVMQKLAENGGKVPDSILRG